MAYIKGYSPPRPPPPGSKLWSTLIVMIIYSRVFCEPLTRNIFNQKHIFATLYACTKEHFRSLFRAFWQLLLKMKKKIGLIAQYSLDIQLFLEKLSEKVHAKIQKSSIVSSFEFTALQKILNRKNGLLRPWTSVCEC